MFAATLLLCLAQADPVGDADDRLFARLRDRIDQRIDQRVEDRLVEMLEDDRPQAGPFAVALKAFILKAVVVALEAIVLGVVLSLLSQYALPLGGALVTFLVLVALLAYCVAKWTVKS